MTLTVMTTTHEHELARWNATAADYPADSCAHELFEEVASSSPDAAAASFGGRELSYRELDGRADRIAHRLRSLGVGLPRSFTVPLLEALLDDPETLSRPAQEQIAILREVMLIDTDPREGAHWKKN